VVRLTHTPVYLAQRFDWIDFNVEAGALALDTEKEELRRTLGWGHLTGCTRRAAFSVLALGFGRSQTRWSSRSEIRSTHAQARPRVDLRGIFHSLNCPTLARHHRERSAQREWAPGPAE
jgi:hypothetical protein